MTIQLIFRGGSSPVSGRASSATPFVVVVLRMYGPSVVSVIRKPLIGSDKRLSLIVGMTTEPQGQATGMAD